MTGTPAGRPTIRQDPQTRKQGEDPRLAAPGNPRKRWTSEQPLTSGSLPRPRRQERVRKSSTAVRKALGRYATKAGLTFDWEAQGFRSSEVCGARCRPGGADDRGVRGPGPSPARAGAPVSAENLIGLILAVLVTVYLVVALLFPEKF